MEGKLFMRSEFGFRQQAFSEVCHDSTLVLLSLSPVLRCCCVRARCTAQMRKYWKPYMIGSAKELVHGASDADFTT